MQAFLLTETNEDALDEWRKADPQEFLDVGWCHATLELAKEAAQESADYMKDEPEGKAALEWQVEVVNAVVHKAVVTRHTATDGYSTWLIREFTWGAVG